MASTYTNLRVHIVFATKDRVSSIDAQWRSDLHSYLAGTVKGLGAVPIALGGVEDHVHLLFGFKATHSISDLVRNLKTSSSAWVSDHHLRTFQWQEGYAAFSISHKESDSVTRYITTQEEHHRKVSSTDELLALLAEFEVPYDPRYFR